MYRKIARPSVVAPRPACDPFVVDRYLAGARYAGWTLLRLPGAVEGLFVDWLAREFPLKSEKVLARLRDARGGALADARFGPGMPGEGPYAEILAPLVRRYRDALDGQEDAAGAAGQAAALPASWTVVGR